MANGLETGLSEQEIKRYGEDGFLVFDGILTDEEVEELRQACEAPQITGLRSQKDYETVTVHALGITSLHPAFLKLAKHPAIVAKLRCLMGEDIQLQHSKLATKPPTKGVGAFAWHQDFAYYPHTNTNMLSVMVMLDDATPENGCMQMVRGSHKFGCLDHMKDGRFAWGCQESRYWESPDNPDDLVYVTPKTGGISIHHTLTLHGSAANASGRPRRGLVFSYRAADAYQLADTLFDDTGLIVSGGFKGVVRCEAGVLTLPYRGGGAHPYGSAWNQIGGFAAAHNADGA
ncbi:phytanoyl-CoA dioxygenase family protein [Paenibacillus sp. MWE-103]|uniref:Phytanoyl-CoA dioxygenase family protein n=1 Tax=Paenibacillus artemisiicola TaxID=1172618 RepID=A0ABS3WIQ9_9BACL|nr:phytanoyl-CoA dioxygenase family protein [Paenibacillus artemisiicola]MBO7748185.1 phytanoyl-CoA dioxygenase family protein [Paenibacillus artemisiicola]